MVITSLYVLEEPVNSDLEALQFHERERVTKKIEDVRAACLLGDRDPRFHHDYTKIEGGPKRYAFYRKWVGRDRFRFVFEVSGERMILVAVIEKDDRVYSVPEYVTRMDEWNESSSHSTF